MSDKNDLPPRQYNTVDDLEKLPKMSMERLFLERENALADWWKDAIDAEIEKREARARAAKR